MITEPFDAVILCFDNSLAITGDKPFFEVVLVANSDGEIWILVTTDFMVDSGDNDVAIVIFHALFSIFYEAHSSLFMIETIPGDIINAGKNLMTLLIN